MAIRIEVSGDGLPRFTRALRELGHDGALRAYTRALNRTGDRANTAVVRALAKQTGLTQRKVRDLGGIRKRRAVFSRMQFDIYSEGGHISLAEFSAKQFSYGVKAKPWGQARRFAGSFIWAGTPRSGIPVGNGHVFRRVGGSSLPIEMMFGPAIPKEIVKDESAEAFEEAADTLPDRLRHEISRLTDRAVT